MTKTTDPRPLPGNDGSWFLELVGSKEADPHHADTLAEMASPAPADEEASKAEPDPPVAATAGVVEAAAPTETSATASLDTGTGETATSGSTDLSPAEAAAVAAATPPTAATDDALSDWEPDEMSRPLRSRRSFRWAAALTVLLLVAAVAAGIILLPRVGEQEADELAADYRQALVDLRNLLPATQEALADLTDASSTPDEIAGVVPATAELSAKSHDVATLGTEPLPQTLPLVPRGPLEELEPTRDAMVIHGAEGDVIALRLGHGFAYRTTVPALLATPDLPTEADTAMINELSVALAESLADTSQLVSELPEDPAFTEVKSQADAATIRFAAWQPEYLEALRSGDVDGATVLVVELDETQTALADANAAALALLRTDLDEQIIVLANDIEATLNAIPT
jgi:hypothetical protein